MTLEQIKAKIQASVIKAEEATTDWNTLTRSFADARAALPFIGSIALKAIEAITNDDFYFPIFKNCHDDKHDDRWCPTCEARRDGIEDFIEAVKRTIEQTTEETP